MPANCSVNQNLVYLEISGPSRAASTPPKITVLIAVGACWGGTNRVAVKRTLFVHALDNPWRSLASEIGKRCSMVWWWFVLNGTARAGQLFGANLGESANNEAGESCHRVCARVVFHATEVDDGTHCGKEVEARVHIHPANAGDERRNHCAAQC